MRLNYQHSVQAAVQVLITQSRIHVGRVWCWPRSPCRYAAREAYWILLCCCLKLATGCIGSGPLQRDSSASLCQMLPVTDPEKSVCSYLQSATCCSLCWAWVHAELTKLHTKAGFYQHWDPGAGQQKSQRTQRSTSACRLSVRLSHLKSLQLYSTAGCKLHRVGQGIPVGQAVAFPQVDNAHGGEYCA